MSWILQKMEPPWGLLKILRIFLRKIYYCVKDCNELNIVRQNPLDSCGDQSERKRRDLMDVRAILHIQNGIVYEDVHLVFLEELINNEYEKAIFVPGGLTRAKSKR